MTSDLRALRHQLCFYSHKLPVSIPQEPPRGILQRTENKVERDGSAKQIRFADEVLAEEEAKKANLQSLFNKESLRTSSKQSKRKEDENLRTPEKDVRNISSHDLFSKPTNVTLSPDMSSPPPPHFSFNMDDLASSPGDKTSSFYSIPPQVPYSPDLEGVGSLHHGKSGYTQEGINKRKSEGASYNLPDRI